MEWIVKQKATITTNECDVIIKRHKSGHNYQTSITFRRSSYVKITTNKYLIFGVEGTKLYFKEADEFSGYKLSSFRSNNQNAVIKLNYNALPTTKIEEGMYNLEFDNIKKLYYIDVKNKIREIR